MMRRSYGARPETSLTTSRTKAVRLLRCPFMRETRGAGWRGVTFCRKRVVSIGSPGSVIVVRAMCVVKVPSIVLPFLETFSRSTSFVSRCNGIWIDRGRTYVAGIQATDDARLLLDFLDHGGRLSLLSMKVWWSLVGCSKGLGERVQFSHIAAWHSVPQLGLKSFSGSGAYVNRSGVRLLFC